MREKNMRNLLKSLWKLILKIPARCLSILERMGIYRFPDFIVRTGKLTRVFRYILETYTNNITNRYIRNGDKPVFKDEAFSIWKDPFLKFQAIWSITNGSKNTPCPEMLSMDLASITQLKGKKYCVSDQKIVMK